MKKGWIRFLKKTLLEDEMRALDEQAEAMRKIMYLADHMLYSVGR